MEKTVLLERQAPMKAWAQYYAHRGWPIIPLHFPVKGGQCSCGKKCSSPGKHPLIRNGVKGASQSIEQINQWWNQWPKANIGVATGPISGLLVVDVDKRHDGIGSLEEWERNFGPLTTLRTETGGDGQHLFFKHPSNTIVRNKVNVVQGIDIRSAGGYAVAPPSMHASGKGYAWKSNQQIAETPSWLISQLLNPTKTTNNHTLSEKIGEGSRNDFLASLAGSLRKRGLSKATIKKELLLINDRLCNPPLDEGEVTRISESIASYAVPVAWGAVEEIPEEKYQIPHMDESFLPGPLRTWIADVAVRMQVPLEFVAAPAIVGFSSLIGRKVGIYPKKNDDWIVVPNLWGALIARPGFFKSPTIAEALTPLEKLVSEANSNFEEKMKEWEVEKSINDAAFEAAKEQLIKAIKKGQEVDIDKMRQKMKEIKQQSESSKPTCKRYKTNDATVEKVANLLLENPNGLLMVRDELYGWLASLNKGGREGDREFYLESWNGYGSFTVDRIGRGTSHIPALCLSVFGGIQPSKLEKYVLSNIEDNDDGLLQRFQILLYPEMSSNWKNYDVSPNQRAKAKVEQLFESVARVPDAKDSKIDGLHFDDEAQDLFNEWRASLEHFLRSGDIKNTGFESHMAKYRKLMPSLALIFHFVENHEAFRKEQCVGAASTRLAIKWCDFLQRHAEKIYKVESNPQMGPAKALAKKIEDQKIRDGSSLRSIYRHHWSQLDCPEKLNGAVRILSDLNWIRVESEKGNSKRSEIVRLNPELCK